MKEITKTLEQQSKDYSKDFSKVYLAIFFMACIIISMALIANMA